MIKNVLFNKYLNLKGGLKSEATPRIFGFVFSYLWSFMYLLFCEFGI